MTTVALLRAPAATPKAVQELSAALARAETWRPAWDQTQLETLRNQVRQDRAELREAVEALRELFDQPAPGDIEASWIAQTLDEAKAKRQEVKEIFTPALERLRWHLRSEIELPPEIEDLIRDGILILEGYLDYYTRLHEMLTRHLAERRAVADETMRARPVKGKIDYGKLSREHIARYPKIRARLAE